MGDTSTAMRDPIFYRWHKFIDNLFQQFKATLHPYSKAQLTLPGIHLTQVEIINKTKLKPHNILFTGKSFPKYYNTPHTKKIRYQIERISRLARESGGIISWSRFFLDSSRAGKNAFSFSTLKKTLTFANYFNLGQA